MAKFFGNLNLVLLVGLLIAIGVMTGFNPDVAFNANSVFRWLHVFFDDQVPKMASDRGELLRNLRGDLTMPPILLELGPRL